MRPPCGGNREAHLPTPSQAAQADSRIPEADAHARRTPRAQASEAQRAAAADGDRPQEVVLATGLPALGFPKSARLLTRRDFVVARRGRRFDGRCFVVYVRVREDKDEGARLGLAVSTRVGDSVRRNRVRRLAREVFRRIRGQLGDRDVLMVARPAAVGASIADVERELLGACGR